MSRRTSKALQWCVAIILAVALMITGAIMTSKTMNADSTSSCERSNGTIGTSSWNIYTDCTMEIGPGELPPNPVDNFIHALWGIGDYKHINVVKFTDPAHTVLPEDSSYLFAGLSARFYGLEDLDTHKAKNMAGLFYTYRGPGFNYNLSGWDTSNVKSISSMFVLAHIDYDQDVVRLNTSSVEDFSHVFAVFTGKLYNISHMDTRNATNMWSMFSQTKFQNTLDLNGLNTSKVTNMASMLEQAKGPIDVRGINNLDTSSLDTAYSMFDLSDLRNPDGTYIDLDLSGWNVRKLANADRMFTSTRFNSLNMSGWQLDSIQDGSFLCPHYTHSLTTINGTLDISNWRIGGDANALKNFIRRLIVGDIKGLNSLQFTTPKDYIVMSRIYLTNSDSFDLSNLDLSQVHGIEMDDVGKYDGTPLEKVDVSGSRGSDNTYFFLQTKAKVIDFSGFNARSDTTIRPKQGLEEITITDGMHLFEAPDPPALGGKYTGRWARKTAPGDATRGWVSSTDHAGDDLKTFSDGPLAGGTYVMQEKAKVLFNKNTSDQTTGSIPGTINGEWPNATGGIMIPQTDLKTESKQVDTWSTRTDGTGTTYRQGEYVNQPGDTTLYAVWADRPKNKAIFDQNDGSGRTSEVITGANSITVNCNDVPSKQGATFIGWSKNKNDMLYGPEAGRNGNVIACGYSKNKTITVNNGDNRFYAVWARRPKLIIDENRPTDMKGMLPSTPAIDSDWWIPGTTSNTVIGYQIPGWFVGYSPDGKYRFDGWRNTDGSKFNGATLERDDVTIRAEWSKMKEPGKVTPTDPVTPTNPTNGGGTTNPGKEPSISVLPKDPSIAGNNDDGMEEDSANEPSTDDGRLESEPYGLMRSDGDDGGRNMAVTGMIGIPFMLTVTVSLMVTAGMLSLIRRRLDK